MLKNNMGQSQFIKEASFKLKQQNLLQDFLGLQKDFVSKKRKLQMTMQKRDILLAEVRFLRQRHKYLMAMRWHNLQQAQEPIPPQNSSMQTEDVGKLWRTETKLKNGIINGKRVKKKISWKDQSTVMKLLPWGCADYSRLWVNWEAGEVVPLYIIPLFWVIVVAIWEDFGLGLLRHSRFWILDLSFPSK